MDFDDHGMVNGQEPGDGSLEGGINAYVNALKGKDAPERGQRGRLKFKNKKGGDNDEMDIDEDDLTAAKRRVNGAARGRGGKQKPMRRGLGVEKMRGSAGGAGGIRKPGGGAFKHGLQRRRGGR